MKMTEEIRIEAPREQVFAALNDPDILRQAIPGCQELEKMGEVKCSQPMGVVMAELNGSNVTIFKKGKIVARRIKDKESAKELMNNVLPLIRREI